MVENQNNNLKPRPPIVVVMGHVDHGKTSLLDYIRKTNVTAKEAGGITQSIGAYEITHTQTDADGTQTNAEKSQRSSASSPRESARKITFIDTPGHEAFSKMRQRGAQAADLAILVVAADEGVKPQTKEALSQIQSAKIPFVVAINKIDKPDINLDKVKNELMTAGVLLEGYGGNVSWQAISAKTGQGIQELLDLILLAAEMENLKYDPQVQAKGVIIETLRDNRRGIVVSVIVENGTLKLGENITTSTAGGKIKSLTNFLGENVDSLEPSAPALILGFDSLPQIGEEFLTGEINFNLLMEMPLPAAKKAPAAKGENSDKIQVVLKADNSGSLEALSDIIKAVPSAKPVVILDQSVGRINEGDFRLAVGNQALIIGFKTKLDPTADSLQRLSPITIIASDIIYELVKKFEEYLKSSGAPESVGELEVLAVFGKSEKDKPAGKQGKQTVGGKIIKGLIKNQQKFEIWRNEQSFAKGRVLNLQEQRKDVAEAVMGKEAGLMVEAGDIIKVGDKLKFYAQ